MVVNNLEGIDMIVFDFDCTITSVSTCLMDTETDLSNYIQKHVFRRFVEFVLVNGIKVAIASYGRKQSIVDAMVSIFGVDTPFNYYNVITPQDVNKKWKECFMPPFGLNKNNMLQILSEAYDIEPRNILLLDDSHSNVRNALAAGFKALRTPSCNGFFEVARSFINKWIKEEHRQELIRELWMLF